jgi:hypothetical protein
MGNKILNVVKYIILLTFLASACKNVKVDKVIADPNSLPAEIIEASDNFIISKVGEPFFIKFISLDTSKSKKIKDQFEVHYKLTHPEKSFVDEEIIFYVNNNGKIDTEKSIIGIPSIKETSAEIMFNFNEESARDAALSYGLKEGIKDWKVSYEWSALHKQYVWHVLATYKSYGEDENFRGSGEEVYINPFDGSLISKQEWNIR